MNLMSVMIQSHMGLLCVFLLYAMCSYVNCHGSHGDENDGANQYNSYPKMEDKESNQVATEYNTVDILMPGAIPQQEDQYLCSTFTVTQKEAYITSYDPVASSNMVHHLLLLSCESPLENTGIWACGSICRDGETPKIVYVWTRNAPQLKLPPDVGYRIGSDTKIKYLILQLHYLHPAQDSTGDKSGVILTITREKQRYLQGIVFLVKREEVLPPRQQLINVDVSCLYDGTTELFPIGYRAHAHTLARVISGYRYRDDGSYSLIGKTNPQWPQAFYPPVQGVTIKPNDYLLARCSFNTTTRNFPTLFGWSHNDEMCFSHILYYTDADGDPFFLCENNHFSAIAVNLPPEADDPPPPDPILDSAGEGHQHSSVGHQIEEVANWPVSATAETLGQVSAVAVNTKGQLHLFHRVQRVWDETSFDTVTHKFNYIDDGPINGDTILVLDDNGIVINSFGANMFYMPHGLHIDHNDNIWLTDVALHQVMRIPKGSFVPDLVLGDKLTPGHDYEHFCKPTDVAVLTSGEFFVADGYCNQRIIKYSKDGVKLMSWGTLSSAVERDGYPPLGTFNIPHSLVTMNDKGWLCVADRENGRIQCFDYNGKVVMQMHSPFIGDKLFAITYSIQSGMLYAVNGPTDANGKKKSVLVRGFTLNPSSASVTSAWAPNSGSFSHPHDVTVSRDGNFLYVAEIGPNRVWKFEISKEHSDGSHNEFGLSHGDHVQSKKSQIAQPSDQQETTGNYILPLIITCSAVVPITLLISVLVLLRCYQQTARERLYHKRLSTSAKVREFHMSDAVEDNADESDIDDNANNLLIHSDRFST